MVEELKAKWIAIALFVLEKTLLSLAIPSEARTRKSYSPPYQQKVYKQNGANHNYDNS